MPPGSGLAAGEGHPPTTFAMSARRRPCAAPPSRPWKPIARTARTRQETSTPRTRSARRSRWIARGRVACRPSTGCSSGARRGRWRGLWRCRPLIWARFRPAPARTDGARGRPARWAGRTSNSAAAATPCACGARSALSSSRIAGCSTARGHPAQVVVVEWAATRGRPVRRYPCVARERRKERCAPAPRRHVIYIADRAGSSVQPRIIPCYSVLFRTI